MKPSSNRCFECGRFVGERFAGYESDRASNRGRLVCERCFAAGEYDRAANSSENRQEGRP